MCPGAEKAVSRRRAKVTLIHYIDKCVGFPVAGEKSNIPSTSQKNI